MRDLFGLFCDSFPFYAFFFLPDFNYFRKLHKGNKVGCSPLKLNLKVLMLVKKDAQGSKSISHGKPMSALEICPVIWRTGRSWQCCEKGTISFLTWEESLGRGQLPGAPGRQLWDRANNFQREPGPAFPLQMAHCRMEGPTVGGCGRSCPGGRDKH